MQHTHWFNCQFPGEPRLAGWWTLDFPHSIVLENCFQCCWFGGRKGMWPGKTDWWDADMVICLRRGADLHMAQLMPLPLTISCSSKSRLAPAHLGSPGQRAVKWVLLLFWKRTAGTWFCRLDDLPEGKRNHWPWSWKITHWPYHFWSINWLSRDGDAGIFLHLLCNGCVYDLNKYKICVNKFSSTDYCKVHDTKQ